MKLRRGDPEGTRRRNAADLARMASASAQARTPHPAAASSDGGALTIDDAQRVERKRKRKAKRRARRGNRR